MNEISMEASKIPKTKTNLSSKVMAKVRISSKESEKKKSFVLAFPCCIWRFNNKGNKPSNLYKDEKREILSKSKRKSKSKNY